MGLEDKYVGLLLAIAAGILIGSSIVITKRGLQDASERHGFEGEGYQYLKNPIWWAGMLTMGLGEIANFAAYAFAPAILVTPLGALSVLTGAVLGAYFLKERLGPLGKIGCAICLLGSIIIASHAPPDKEIETVDEILHYAIQPAFLIYCLFVAIFSAVMIYKIAPKYGKKNPLYYLSICATTGSISVMSVKAFGIALKLTFAGKNQFTHPSTYAFAIVVAVSILTQMNYFNKALNTFSQSIVNALYYVTFTTCVLVASFILFQGFNTTDAINTVSLICGFVTIFLGVFLLDMSRKDPTGQRFVGGREDAALPADGIAALQTRYSMQSQRSFDGLQAQGTGRGRRSMSNGSIVYSPRNPPGAHWDREGLMHEWDAENQAYGLADLSEDSEGERRGANGHADAAINGKHVEKPD